MRVTSRRGLELANSQLAPWRGPVQNFVQANLWQETTGLSGIHMPSKKHSGPDELVTQLLGSYRKPEDLIGENGRLKQLTKLRVEQALDAEMTQQFGHDKHESVTDPASKNRKTLKCDFGELSIEVPRDRHSTFEARIAPKLQPRWAAFDEKILSRYARGMTASAIQSHLEKIYGAVVRRAHGATQPNHADRDWKAAPNRFTIAPGKCIAQLDPEPRLHKNSDTPGWGLRFLAIGQDAWGLDFLACLINIFALR